MSHITTIKTVMSDPETLRRACDRLGLDAPEYGEHKLFAEGVSGWGFRLPGWDFPAVIDDNGDLHYDNYEGKWGDIKELHRLQQMYAVEAVLGAHSTSETSGWNIWEEAQEDGSTKIIITE